MPTGAVGLTAEQFGKVFPFHLAFSADGRLLQIGDVLARVAPALVVGDELAPRVTIARPRVPFTFADIREKTHSLFILRLREPELTLRGQMVIDEEQRIGLFLGSPWLTRMEEAADVGLSLSDFANHDSVGEFLLLFQTKDLALADAEALADRLQDQGAQLRAANLKLGDQERLLRDSNEALSRAARLKDEFLSNMSHELRTPLNAILGMSESLMEEVYGPIDARQRRAISLIESSGRHLLELINDILDLSRIEAGRMDLDRVSTDVSALSQASMAMVRQAAAKKDLSLRLVVDPTVTLVVADQRRLKQMLVNLLSNAVKFTPDGGQVTLSVSGEPANGLMRLAVADTGIGIAEADIPRLFTPFGQLDAGLARHHGGTGLGLALTRRMVELHGGTIGVVSRVGHGSTFTLTLPWQPTAEVGSTEVRRATREAATETAGASGRILIVDDDASNREVLADYLTAHHFDVATATSAGSGLHIARLIRPDIILMDVQMPDMDGLEATSMIRRDPILARTPVFALTGLAMKGDRERCLAAGMDEYVTKPVRLSALLELIRARLVSATIQAVSS